MKYDACSNNAIVHGGSGDSISILQKFCETAFKNITGKNDD